MSAAEQPDSLFFIPSAPDARAPAGARVTTLTALLDLVDPDYRESLSDAVKDNVRRTMLTALAGSGLALLAVGPVQGGMLCQLTSLDGLHVPADLSQRVLGVRREAVHDLCNDLSAARLNGELALRLLDRDDGVAGAEVLDALHALVRVTVEVEEGLRHLQQQLELDLSGRTP